MADISKVTLPNNASYNIKDANAVHSVNVTPTVVSGETTKEIAKIGVDGTDISIYADDTDKILHVAFDEHTVTGNPVTADAFLGLEVVSECKVTMLPIQDLHGYEYPWVGGAGKNKFQTTATSGTKRGITYTINSDGTVTTNGTATAYDEYVINESFTLPSGSYILNGCPSGSGNTRRMLLRKAGSTTNIAIDTGSGASFDLEETTELNLRITVSNNIVLSDYVFKPMIRLASETDATFAPYSNICPISGRDSVTVKRTGKNLFNGEIEQGTLSESSPTGTAYNSMKTNNANRCRTVIPFKAIQYPITISVKSGYKFFQVYLDDEDKYLGSFYSWSQTFTLNNPSLKKVGIIIKNDAGTAITPIECADLLQIEIGSTATAYEPYQGETHTHTYESTVYGAVDDFASGEGKKTHAYLSYNSFTRTNDHQFYKNVGSNVANRYGRKNIICDRMPTADSSIPTGTAVNAVHTNSSGAIIVHTEEAYSTASAFMTAMGGQLNFAVRTSAGADITNTPEDVTLLKGVNVLSTDGDSLELKYSADIKAYIDKKLEALS